MAETICTRDGKLHALLGSTSVASIILDYCGEELLLRIKRRVLDICEDIEEITACSDMGIDEQDLLYDKLDALKSIFG